MHQRYHKEKVSTIIEKAEQVEQRLSEICIKESQFYQNCIDLIAAANYLPQEILHFEHLSLSRNIEGNLRRRPYAGTKHIDKLEELAASVACSLFDAEYANVQPHSGTQANQAVYAALLKVGDTVLAMDFSAGGHLTHGMGFNFSGKLYDFHHYSVDPETHLIDYNQVEDLAKEKHPKLIVCGGSSYPRFIDFAAFREIADKHDCLLMADIAHYTGLIATGNYPNPFPHADVVTASLEKTVRGPPSGIILSKRELADKIRKSVHPGIQSSFPNYRIAQIAKCLIEAMKPEFNEYISTVLENAQVLSQYFNSKGKPLVSGGTDIHFIILDVVNGYGQSGKQAEKLLEHYKILTNRQLIPYDDKKPFEASGLRIGTPPATSRGYDVGDFQEVAELIDLILSNNKKHLPLIHQRVKSLVVKERKDDLLR